MSRQYSVTEVRNHFASLIREVEQQTIVELTRRGKPVAVLLSIREHNRLTAPHSNFWEAYTTFRDQVNLQELSIGPDTWADIRGS
jgi:antitoxin Phd